MAVVCLESVSSESTKYVNLLSEQLNFDELRHVWIRSFWFNNLSGQNTQSIEYVWVLGIY